MPEFDYQAVSHDEFKTGKITADSETAAQTVLVEQGLTPLSLERRRPLNLGLFTRYFSNFQTQIQEHLTPSEKVLFTGQLSSMIKAGLPLIDALSAFTDENRQTGPSRIVGQLILQLQSGVKFSSALSGYPKIFPNSYLAVVRAGEGSGTLAESLNYLAAQLRRENELGNKVKSALVYPTVVLSAMIAVMTFIGLFVVPKILTFAQNAGQPLPDYTLILINIINFVIGYWYLVLLILGALFTGFILFIRTDYGRHWFDQFSLRLPIIGLLAARYHQARFARVLGGFYLYGVDIISSFDILAQSLPNILYRDSCLRIKQRLTVGASLAQAISQETNLYPSIMIRLVRGAEKAGELGATLDKLAIYYEEELEVALRNVLTLIEPALVFVLGFGVLALALAVVVPIYTVTSALR